MSAGLSLTQDEPVEDEHVEPGSEEHPNSIARRADDGLQESIEGGVHKNGDARRGAGLLNTSFNGFLEPIVCSPRDRFSDLGTGLDMLVLDRFILRK